MSRWIKCPEEWAGELSQLLQRIEKDGLRVAWSDCDECIRIWDLDEESWVEVSW